MTKSYTLLLLCLTAGLLHAQNNVVFTFNHQANGQTLTPGETLFTIWNGKTVRIDRAQFYLAELTLQQTDGTWLALPDAYILADASQPGQQHEVGSVAADNIQAVGFGLGVDEAHNHLDPTLYPADHPLALHEPSMHWGWAGGYRFLVVEGKIDNNNDGNPESTFEYHCLGNQLYDTTTVNGAVQAQNGTLNIALTLDYAQLFKNMSMSGNLIHHGSTSSNAAMMTNAHRAGFFSIAAASSAFDPADLSRYVTAAPNPCVENTWITLDFPVAGDVQLNLVNEAGQTVRSMAGLPPQTQTRLQTAGLPAGVYHAVFTQNGAVLAQKTLVVQ